MWESLRWLRVRRLRSFWNPTIAGIPPYDRSNASYVPAEAELLAIARRYCAASLKANHPQLHRAALVSPTIVFDILGDATINAFACRKKSHDAIFLHSGLVVALYLLYSRLLQYSEGFPWATQQTSHRAVPPQLTALPATFEDITLQMLTHIARMSHGEPISNLVLPYTPEDPARRELANCLWRWSLNFVLFHELAHILHGHVDFLASIDPASVFRGEKSTMPLAAVASIKPSLALDDSWYELRRSQELQADRFAVAATFLPLALSPGSLPSTLRVSDRLIYTWGFALATIFTVFAHLDAGNGTTASHPPPHTRLATSMFAVDQALARHGATPSVNVTTTILRAWKDVDRLFHLAFGDIFHRFFLDQQPYALKINVDSILQSYPYQEHWHQHDRLGRLAGKGSEIALAVIP